MWVFSNFDNIVDDGCKVWTPSELKHLQKHRRVWVAGKPRGLCGSLHHQNQPQARSPPATSDSSQRPPAGSAPPGRSAGAAVVSSGARVPWWETRETRRGLKRSETFKKVLFFWRYWKQHARVKEFRKIGWSVFCDFWVFLVVNGCSWVVWRVFFQWFPVYFVSDGCLFMSVCWWALALVHPFFVPCAFRAAARIFSQ